jgi:hypothetical protein
MQVLPGKQVRGRPVRVNYKTERGSGQPSRDARMPTKTYDRGWRAQTVPPKDVGEDAYVYDRWSRDDAPSRWTAPLEEGRRLFVGGLPQIPNQDALNAEMKELFQGFNVEAVSKIISPNDYWRSKPGSHHYCFVDLSSAEEAQKAAAALNGKATPYGGSYGIKAATAKKPTKVMREQLGVTKDGEAPAEPPKPQRNLQGSWRRMD